MSLSVEFDLSKRGEGPNVMLEAWEAVVPRGVAFGRQLYQSGELRRKREAGNNAEEVLNWLETLYNSINSS